jgi:hypothetical protein
LEKGGFKVLQQVWEVSQPRRRVTGYVVLSPRGESYHIEDYNNWRFARVWSNAKGDWIQVPVAKRALKEAIKAFEQRRLAAKEAGLPNNVTVLVYRQDSYEAGNCRPGTEDFLRRQGWENRRYVPAQWLLESHNALARNAALIAACKVKDLMAA